MANETEKITHREKKTCLGKIKHKHKSAAEFVMDQMPKDKTLEAYECRYCGLWHIGHNKKR